MSLSERLYLFHFEHDTKAHTNAKIAIITDIVNQATHFLHIITHFRHKKRKFHPRNFSYSQKFNYLCHWILIKHRNLKFINTEIFL